jgi:hypothetical protein
MSAPSQNSPARAPSPKRLGRGLDDFSHLYFSRGRSNDGDGPARSAPIPGQERPSADAFPQPRTLFVTGFRRGCGKTFIASGIARECARAGAATHEWQLAGGVVVPRRSGDYARPIPHPSEGVAFEAFATQWIGAAAIVMDGPVSLFGEGDPFALAAAQCLVVVSPGPDGAAEGYAAIKEILGTRPDMPLRVVVNRAASQGEARETFHRISDVASRYLGRPVRSYGGLPLLNAPREGSGGRERDSRALLFSRVARNLLADDEEAVATPAFFHAVWSQLSAGGA